MTEKRGRGYIGKSMSVNAAEAYKGGEMPLSKWTKDAIIEDLEYNYRDDLAGKAKALPAWLLKEFLEKSSWHHTGAFYSQTNFYSFNAEKLEALAGEEIEEMKAERKAKLEHTKESRKAKREAAAVAREIKMTEKEKETELLKLKKYSSYKSDGGFLKAIASGKVKEADLIAKRKAVADEQRKRLAPMWEKQSYTYGLEKINDDEFIASYA